MELLKLLLIFALIIVFLGLKKPLSLVMAGATVLLGLLFAMPVLDWLRAVGASMISWSTLEVVFIIWAVMLLEGLMGENGYLDRMMKAVDDLFHSRKMSMLTMPMLIGFLPSAGGALFSAPLVETASQGSGLSGERKAQINAYYRHIMEIFFPTYPSAIVVCGIAKVPLSQYTMVLFPMAALAFLLGLWLVRNVKDEHEGGERIPLSRRLLAFLISLWPFLLLLVLIIVFDMEVYLACLISLVAVMIVTRFNVRELPRLIREKTKWKLLLMAYVVMIFKDVLLSSGAVEALPDIISRLPVPPAIVFSLMTLFIGLITGITFSATAITMPLMMSALPSYGIAQVALIHLSAYVACQLTPTHLCISISSEYFKANLQKMILGYLPLYLILYAVNLLVFGWILA
ncbi:MAG: DUF401 family protein [Firmicutes bacterium]|nr:DUF401 family protein [Bacillota bacterium]MBQ6607263.1 DUF401 family protein [Bacillota bacterium]